MSGGPYMQSSLEFSGIHARMRTHALSTLSRLVVFKKKESQQTYACVVGVEVGVIKIGNIAY